MNSDPWQEIAVSQASNKISARRVPEIGSSKWGLYWAVDSERHCLLILQIGTARSKPRRLPNLRGLSVEAIPTEDESGERVIIRLTEAEHREVFHRFCVDVIDATKVAKSEKEAVERFLTRTWRWHRLLQSGRNGKLSADEQKGLIGELRVIEQYLLNVINAIDAVEGWTGPLGSPKDFSIGMVGIEAKARSPQRALVRISSIDQLDSVGNNRLFLTVTEVGVAFVDSEASFTVSDMAARIRDQIKSQDVAAGILFDDRLVATGFDWEEDYSDDLWTIGDEVIYEVVEGFPRLTPSMVPAGVNEVRYDLSLASCESYRTDHSDFFDVVSGVDNES